MLKARHDIIVVGASAGGVEALLALVGGLPPDLPAALLVVLHLSPTRPSHLPAILTRYGALPAVHPAAGDPIRAGCIYVAPPDLHLLVRAGTVELTRGPRENRMRPAIDVLFRSAARAYGPRVTGVVLSGTLDDGARGLMAIAARGGVTVVQDPTEALFDGMPRAALRHTRVDAIMPAAEMGSLLTQLAGTPVAARRKGEKPMDQDQAEDQMGDEKPAVIRRDMAAQAHDQRAGATTVYTCPECGGTLWQIDHGGLTQFHCHVGHTYGTEALLGQMSEDLEAALWRSVRILEEKATLTRQIATRLRATGHHGEAASVGEQAAVDDSHGRLIRETLLENLVTPLGQALDVAQVEEQAQHADGTGSWAGEG